MSVYLHGVIKWIDAGMVDAFVIFPLLNTNEKLFMTIMDMQAFIFAITTPEKE